MRRELTPKEVIYNEDFTSIIGEKESYGNEYEGVFRKIDEALSINKEGFNVYLIDEFSKQKLKDLISHLEDKMKSRGKPKDICYVTLEDIRVPKVIFLENGMGEKLDETLEYLKSFYYDEIYAFYNSSINKEKEEIINDIQKKRNYYIGDLIKSAKEEGFDLKATSSGFAFIPLVDGEAMTEEEFDDLEENSKGDISVKADKLKEGAEGVLEELKNIELDSIEKLKEILRTYLENESASVKGKIKDNFKNENEAYNYLIDVCESLEKLLVDNYTINFDDDEEKINEIFSKYVCNIIKNSKGQEAPKVIFEEDPSLNNLLGTIEYENHNGVYSTDVKLIKSGSLLEANEGCIILRLSSLVNNANSYYYLRRTLLHGKINYDFNRGYLEVLSLNGLNPDPIPIKVNVILIGDFESYDILYNNDEDFKKIFRVRAEFSSLIGIDENKRSLLDTIDKIIIDNELIKISTSGINAIGKQLARKAGTRKKILWDIDEIERILLLGNEEAKNNNKSLIDKDSIEEVINQCSEIEKDYLEMYEEKKIILDIEDRIIGSVNGLSVIDFGYMSFGKPIRITCTCYKGSGKIMDAQRESNLSGNIHNKSLNILRGFLSSFFNSYEALPVDFQLSFEQLYGKIEGDSASVAEVIAMISSLSKIPVDQSIAVTGSLNQFGQVQPIGGVNEKIEGFFNVCKKIDTYIGKAVLIPESNKGELILNSEIEEAVRKGEFKIYLMKDINEALSTLLLNDTMSLEDIGNKIREEIKKFNDD
ncbi:TPA: AAA family ATPase [Clostridium perfringens]|uniref:AAA family ATPase n=1 Tax=Clostridium perfringens TaxID=1502 RepID=UPI0013E39398|nr:AAA family ATPase [Clostridium perfringens]MDK0609205.1 AAA family ATPase [Clostridium perfringens]MDK0619728.1 AAA family ATPase [Clostridium perfringens]MDM0755452.1 AAA family ATPase [Clostridium perfringens]MDM0758370.1 AAA family ATPase [Clostridium perfringens]MDM0761309.1 AAA family ATPase [Clostridium perfringens]